MKRVQEMLQEENQTFHLVEQPYLDISSTAIRKACREGRPIHQMYDESTYAVVDYIKKWKLWTPFSHADNNISQNVPMQKEEETKKEKEHEKEKEKQEKQENHDEDSKHYPLDSMMDEVLSAKEQDTSIHHQHVKSNGIYSGPLPTSPIELTKENLSHMLMSTGVCAGGIKSFSHTRPHHPFPPSLSLVVILILYLRIGLNRGWRAVLARIVNIEYELEEDQKNAPSSLVVKFTRGTRVSTQKMLFIYILWISN